MKQMDSYNYFTKTIIFISMMLIWFYLNAESTTNIDGYYLADETEQYGNVIQIKNDSLMIYSWVDFIRDNPDSLSIIPRAICKMNRCSDNFYELNSIGGSVLSVWRDISISADTTDCQQERLKDMSVYFTLPNMKRDMLLIYYDDNNKEKTDTIVNGEAHVFIKDFHRKTMQEYYTFYIYPMKYNPSSLWGQFYGVLYYEIMPFRLINWRNTSKVSIILRGITDNATEQYLLKGDYIRIVGDTITWKNCSFKRQIDISFRSIQSILERKSIFHHN